MKKEWLSLLCHQTDICNAYREEKIRCKLSRCKSFESGLKLENIIFCCRSLFKQTVSVDTWALDWDIVKTCLLEALVSDICQCALILWWLSLFVHSHTYRLCCALFLQPSDDFEACFYADVGEFSNLRIEVWLSHPPNE